MPIGVVTGLRDEARIARVIGDTEVGGGTPWGAEVAAEKLVARGATALLSFGLAGGLDPSLRPGDIVIPLAILETGGSYPTDPALSKAAGGWFGGLLVASERIVVTREAKRRLFETTRAAAVDLESGAVARVAARHNLPFTTLRAICDPADRTLPPAAILAVGPGGRVNLVRVFRSVARHPSQISALATLASDGAKARRALARAAASLAERLSVTP